MAERTVYLETFGCQMNELDSELVEGSLRALGYRFVGDADEADVVLYNTCSVRDHAEQKVRSRLGELRRRKADNPALVVGVLGCMAERDGAALIDRAPVVDVLCGPAELDRVPALIDNALKANASLASEHAPLGVRSARQVALQGGASRRSGTLAAAEDRLELLDLSRAVSPTDHAGSAYVRITRGCNKFCTYCVVPHTRGAEIHRPPDHIVEECRRLADAGVTEVTLLGQTVNHYRFEHGSAVTVGGVTQPQKGRTYRGAHRRDMYAGANTTTFADLLARIHDEAPGITRLRFVTSYPRDFGDDALQVMRDCERICRYLHVPAQSGSDEMLRRMNRGYSVSEYLEFLDRARSCLHQPEIGRPLTVSGDMIVGFCGETEADHEASLALLRRTRYKNCFIFKYSPRPGTTAYDRLPDDVPDEVKRRRNNEMLAVQAEASREVMREFVGGRFEAIVEGESVRQRKKSAPAKGGHGAVALTIGGREAGAEDAVEPAESIDGPTQLSARTDTDCIVHFDCPEGVRASELVGRVVTVEITGSDQLFLRGKLLEGAPVGAA